MKKSYIVYMHTLLCDGRKYIGITSLAPSKRWRNGKGYKNQSYFYNTIQKYGWDNFKHDIIFNELTKEQACLKEQALIKLFNTTNPKYGFNMTKGGEHYEFSEEALINVHKGHDSLRIAISKEDLEYQYIILDKTIQECSVYFSCSTRTISRYLKVYNISKDFTTKEQKEKQSNLHRLVFISYDDLYYQYIILNKTQSECAKHFKCSLGPILYWLSEYNIEKKHCIGKKVNISREALNEQFNILKKSITKCAEYFECSRTTIKRYLVKYDLMEEC